MKLASLAELVVISGAVGLGAYGLSCAVHVWRVRQAKLAAASGRGNIVRRALAVLLVAGLLGAALSVAWQAVVSHEGLLSGDGLFTVRRPSTLEVAAVTDQDVVKKGALLAHYHSPQSEAELAVLELRRRGLEIEKQVLLHQPLAVDPEITQKLIELNAQQRALQTNLNDLVLEKERLLRDALRDRLAKEDEINGLQSSIDKLQSELAQARGALELCEKEFQRHTALHRQRVLTEQEFSEKANELQTRQLEVGKLEEQYQNLDKQKKELERGLATATAFSQQQSHTLDARIVAVEDRLEEITTGLSKSNQQRDQDLTRAARHRRESLHKVEVQLQQTERQRVGLERTLQARAPFGGRVAYRAPSPGSISPEEPLVVLAPPNGLRLSVRLPRWMKRPLERAGEVSCELLEDLERDEQRRFVQCRFAGRLVAWDEMPDHPGYGLAELACDPPDEAIRMLAAEEQIAARLVWRPPLYTVPAFVLSLAAAGVAGLGLAVAGRGSRPEVQGPVHPVASPPLKDAHPATAMEYGAEGAVLRMLGSQLRETIARGELDLHVIAAAEWALDRHRARAVRLLALGLGDVNELGDHLESLVKDLSGGQRSVDELPADAREAVHRLRAILRTIAPRDLGDKVDDLVRRFLESRPEDLRARAHRAASADPGPTAPTSS